MPKVGIVMGSDSDMPVMSKAADILEKADDFDIAVHDLIKKYLTEHQRIIFNGNGYSEEWVEEAARRGQLDAYRHNGFWQCMDTMNEKKKLEEMWRSGNAPWKVWE